MPLSFFDPKTGEFCDSVQARIRSKLMVNFGNPYKEKRADSLIPERFLLQTPSTQINGFGYTAGAPRTPPGSPPHDSFDSVEEGEAIFVLQSPTRKSPLREEVEIEVQPQLKRPRSETDDSASSSRSRESDIKVQIPAAPISPKLPPGVHASKSGQSKQPPPPPPRPKGSAPPPPPKGLPRPPKASIPRVPLPKEPPPKPPHTPLYLPRKGSIDDSASPHIGAQERPEVESQMEIKITEMSNLPHTERSSKPVPPRPPLPNRVPQREASDSSISDTNVIFTPKPPSKPERLEVKSQLDTAVTEDSDSQLADKNCNPTPENCNPTPEMPLGPPHQNKALQREASDSSTSEAKVTPKPPKRENPDTKKDKNTEESNSPFTEKNTKSVFEMPPRPPLPKTRLQREASDSSMSTARSIVTPNPPPKPKTADIDDANNCLTMSPPKEQKNKLVQSESESLPLSPTLDLETPDVKPDVNLPPGWISVWSKSQQRWYFFDTKTNKSVWTWPP